MSAFTDQPIRIALSKGRIFNDTMPLLRHAGIEPLEDPESSRKLILDTNHPNIKLVIIRASDVPTYVEYGAADLGVAGKDVLMEQGSRGIYEPLDLDIAKCKLMVAGFANHSERGQQELGHLRVATKYVQTTQRYYAQKGQQVEVIKLYGSMELAPIVGLADCIVDVVDTGGTLKANGLVPLETIAEISSRLIVNKAAMKLKNSAIKAFIAHMAEAVQRKKDGEKKL